MSEALEHGTVLFLFDESNAAHRSRAFRKLHGFIGGLPEHLRARFELKVLPTRGLERFATIESQEATLDALVEWAEQCFPAVEHPQVAGRATATSIGDPSSRV
jgi:hypothetical protein